MINLKPRRIIIVSSILVVVLCFMVMLLDNLSKNRASKNKIARNNLNNEKIVNQLNDLVSINTLPTKLDTPKEKPFLTCEYEVEVIPTSIKIIDTLTENEELILKPEFIEQVKQRKEELQKPVSGLFDTKLNIKQEDTKVKFIFSIQNISEEDLTFYFSSGQKFDIIITNRSNEGVYRWSQGKGFIAVMIDSELKKDETLFFEEVWDYKDNEGNRLPPGKYCITVELLANLKNNRKISSDELMAVKELVIQ